MREPYTFRGFEDVEQEMRALVSDASYLVLQDRTDPNLDEPIGRFELTEASARAWLPLIDNERSGGADLPLKRFIATGRSRQEAEDDDLDLGEDDGEDDELDEEEAPAERLARHDRTGGRLALSRAEILDVACWWVRQVAARNTFAQPHRRFRVRVYGHKATKTLYCGQFAVINDSHREQIGGGRRATTEAAFSEPPQHTPPVASPSAAPLTPARTGVVEQEGVAVGMRALGEYYAQFGQLLLGSVTHLQSLSNNVVARLDDHLKETRDQLDQVLAALVEKRFAEAEAAEHRANEARTAAHSDKLVKEGVSALGDVAKAMLISKGVNAEAAELVGLLDKNPDLAEALKDPNVKQMMADPQKVKDLAGTLKQVGQMAAVAQGMQPGPVTNPQPAPQVAQAYPQPSMVPPTYAPTGMPYQLVPIQNAAEFDQANGRPASPIQNAGAFSQVGGNSGESIQYATELAPGRGHAPGHDGYGAEHQGAPSARDLPAQPPSNRRPNPSAASGASFPSRRGDGSGAQPTRPNALTDTPDNREPDDAWLLEGFEPRRERPRRPRP